MSNIYLVHVKFPTAIRDLLLAELSRKFIGKTNVHVRQEKERKKNGGAKLRQHPFLCREQPKFNSEKFVVTVMRSKTKQ